LPKGSTSRLPVGCLELRHLEPAQKRIGPDADSLGGFLDVPLGEQRGDRFFLLAPEFGPVPLYLTQPDATWRNLWPARLPIASSSPSSIYRIIALLFKHFRVIHVMTAQSVAPRRTIMTTFTIDNDNNITAHGTPEEAAAATTTPFGTFASEKELAGLAAAWPAERLVAIWNSLPGVTPVKRFKNSNAAANRIWERIQNLGAPEQPQPEQPAKPKAERKAKGGARTAKGKAARKITAAKNAPKSKTAAKAREATAPREGSKTAQVVAMLQRKNGATLAEIMDKMGWQKHTVRGFMAGSLKKAGYTVESFKSDKGERTYRINS
jgi:hypothetical protein